MRNSTTKLIAALAVLATPLAATEAAAKVKEVKFHIVQGAYEDLPVMEMKYSNGKWNWANKSKHFKPRLKVYFKTSLEKANNAYVQLNDTGQRIWELPLNYATKKYEKLVTLGIGSAVMSPFKGKAAAVCDVFGGSKKVVRDVNLGATMHVSDKFGNSGKKNGAFPIKVVCQAKQSAPSSLVVAQLKLYTVPAKPLCGKPVALVTEIHTNKPGKVDFTLFRGDGAKQNASVVTAKAGTLSVKQWIKSYSFTKSENRKYMVVLKGHNKSTNWVPISVNCGVGGGNGINNVAG